MLTFLVVSFRLYETIRCNKVARGEPNGKAGRTARRMFLLALLTLAGLSLLIRRPGYLAAAIVGLGCKWWVHAGAIHGIGTAARVG